MWVSVTKPPSTVTTVYVAEKVKKKNPTEEVVIPREDKCSSRRLKEKPKEEKAAVKVVRRAVRKNGDEMRG